MRSEEEVRQELKITEEFIKYVDIDSIEKSHYEARVQILKWVLKEK